MQNKSKLNKTKISDNSRADSIAACKKMKKKPKMTLETQLMRHSNVNIRNFKPVRESVKNDDTNSRSTSARFYQQVLESTANKIMQQQTSSINLDTTQKTETSKSKIEVLHTESPPQISDKKQKMTKKEKQMSN